MYTVENLKEIMQDAWDIARKASRKFKSKASDFISESMKISWKTFKESAHLAPEAFLEIAQEAVESEGVSLDKVKTELKKLLKLKSIQSKASVVDGKRFFNRNMRKFEILSKLKVRLGKKSMKTDKRSVARKTLILSKNSDQYEFTGKVFTWSNCYKYKKYLNESVCYAYPREKIKKAQDTVTFEYWYNTIADIPEKDSNGNWFDLETGLYFN